MAHNRSAERLASLTISRRTIERTSSRSCRAADSMGKILGQLSSLRMPRGPLDVAPDNGKTMREPGGYP